MSVKLSDRQRLLLLLIDDVSQWEGDERPGKVNTRFWIPHAEQWAEVLKTQVSVCGTDFSCLGALHRRGLIAPVKTTLPHAYLITEDGIHEAARIL